MAGVAEGAKNVRVGAAERALGRTVASFIVRAPRMAALARPTAVAPMRERVGRGAASEVHVGRMTAGPSVAALARVAPGAIA